MQPATIASLPTELLAACLGQLDFKHRHLQAALVSKAFYAACHVPELLRTVDAKWNGNVMLKSRSLEAWLARHGQHVRSLKVDAEPFPVAAEKQWVSDTLRSCLASCAQLQQLDFKPVELLSHAHWALPLQSLRHADLHPGGNVHPANCPTGLQLLSSLSSMRLGQCDIGSTVRLPPGLTKLVAYMLDVENHQTHPVGALSQLAAPAPDCLRSL